MIHYTVTAASDGKSVAFLGDPDPGHSRYRLTYSLTQPTHITITLEMASPAKPDQFQKIIDGRMKQSDTAS